MTITNITPAEQALALAITQLQTDRDFWRKQAEDYRRQADQARDMLDQARNIIREQDAKLLRGKV